MTNLPTGWSTPARACLQASVVVVIVWGLNCDAFPLAERAHFDASRPTALQVETEVLHGHDVVA